MTDDTQEPLLRHGPEDEENVPLKPQEEAMGWTLLIESAGRQLKMAMPLLLNFIATYAVNIISLSFVGHLGKTQLAAAALGISFIGIVARTVLMGLSGALDTRASQAFGAGNIAAIGVHFKRTVIFLWLHCVPISALLLAAPMLLKKQGEEAELGRMASDYIRCLLPAVWLDAINRPINSVLVAQRITTPQMISTLVVIPLHVGTNYLFIFTLKFGYLGAAIAMCCSSAYLLILTTAQIALSGRGPSVWGAWYTPLNLAQGWRDFATLAYPACFMKCAESWGFSIMTLASGLLPEPDTSVAAISVAFNIYGILFMAFAAFSMTAGSQVGNALGAGNANRAKAAALVACIVGPLLWAMVAVLLLEPHTQHSLMLVFTDGKDAELMYHLKRLLFIVVGLELFDGGQTIMTGVIQGCGKQRLGVLVNIGAFYLCAIPLALYLGFVAKKGVEGMYLGMMTGPAIQAACYTTIIARINWQHEAAKTNAGAAAPTH